MMEYNIEGIYYKKNPNKIPMAALSNNVLTASAKDIVDSAYKY